MINVSDISQNDLIEQSYESVFKIEQDTFPDGLKPLNTSEFDSNQTFKDYFENPEMRMIATVLKLLKKALSEYVDIFFESFPSVFEDENNNSILFLYLVFHVENS